MSKRIIFSRMAPRKKKAAPAGNASAVQDVPMDGAGEAAQEEETKCPGCKDDDGNEQNKDTWICCDACKSWYHWGPCAGIDSHANSGEGVLTLDQIDKWSVDRRE